MTSWTSTTTGKTVGMTMKKNKLFLGIGLGTAVVLLVVRVLQLFSLNDQGTVSVPFLTVALYAVLVVAAVVCFVVVRRKDAVPTEALPDRVAKDICFFLGIALCCNALFLFFDGATDRSFLFACLFSLLAGLCLAVTYVLRTFFKGTGAGVTEPLGIVFLLGYLVANTIHLFVNNRTALALVLNSLTFVTLCAELFFFKALIREYLSLPTDASRASLTRSALLLLAVLPSELAGQLLVRHSRFDSLAVHPVCSHSSELCVHFLVLALVVAVLLPLLFPSTSPALPELSVDEVAESSPEEASAEEAPSYEVPVEETPVDTTPADNAVNTDE